MASAWSSLPDLWETLKLKTIEYSPHGFPISDAECEVLARSFLESNQETIKVANDNFILAIRVLIKEGHTQHMNVRFLFEDRYIYSNKDGRLEEWPNGFCDTAEKLLCRMLKFK
jgi:transcriptional regulator